MRLANPNPGFVLALALAALLPLAAGAKTSDRDQPMDVAADHTDAMLGDDSDSVLSGNVVISQGTMQVHADKAVIHRKDGDITQVELTGTPASLKQVGDNGEPMDASAAQIVYTLSSDLVVLTGGVVVKQPRGTLQGETIKYDLNTGRLDGGSDGNRVQMRILPKSKPASGTP
jgi:lipopolysaccharide export system protein LptA